MTEGTEKKSVSLGAVIAFVCLAFVMGFVIKNIAPYVDNAIKPPMSKDSVFVVARRDTMTRPVGRTVAFNQPFDLTVDSATVTMYVVRKPK